MDRQKRLSEYTRGEPSAWGAGRKSVPRGAGESCVPPAPTSDEGGARSGSLLAQALHPDNVEKAIERVVENGGAPGVDGMRVEAFPAWWAKHRFSIRAKLLAGRYRPSPVRRAEIPKLGARGTRALGIPTVLDRVIQQAILQVLQPVVDPSFSEHSYGFRPGRGAHDAVRAVQGFVADGYTWVVDLDLERFFDRVHHDVLMDRVSKRVDDKSLLRLIRRYLQAGVMVEGVRVATEEGTPQGGPLSPLLANILLDELDGELTRRGHRFARYADDCNIYVRSEAAGERVFASVSRFLEKRLRLRVNREKSGVDRPWNRTFLGFTFLVTSGGVRLQASKEARSRFRERVRGMMRRARGDRLERTVGRLNRFLRGWFGYFRISEVPRDFEELDGWVRRRLRCVVWRHWKRPRTRQRELRKRGIKPTPARRYGASSKGAWAMSRSSVIHRALPNAWFAELGLFSLLEASETSTDPA